MSEPLRAALAGTLQAAEQSGPGAVRAALRHSVEQARHERLL